MDGALSGIILTADVGAMAAQTACRVYNPTAGAATGSGGGGGGGGGGAIVVSVGKPNFFHAPINTLASAAVPTTATNVLGITEANVYTNRGDAVLVETGSATRQRLKVLKEANYTIKVALQVTVGTSGSTRTNILAEFDYHPRRCGSRRGGWRIY